MDKTIYMTLCYKVEQIWYTNIKIECSTQKKGSSKPGTRMI